MDLSEARQLAEAKLREVERASRPLQLDPDSYFAEYTWCWLFSFNSVRYSESGNPLDAVLTGPVVVNKDGSDVWIAPSAPPLDARLNDYASRHGYPPVSGAAADLGLRATLLRMMYEAEASYSPDEVGNDDAPPSH
ncbi:YrhB domain-containing protein [Micromonospora chokoriensis]